MKNVIQILLMLLIWIGTGSSLLFLFGCAERPGVKIGEPSPKISGTDIFGKEISLDRLKGKIVVIYFWTNSCCGNNLKDLKPFFEKNRDKDLVVLAINEIDTKKDIESYAKDNSLNYTMLADEHAFIFKQYKGFGFPSIFILDRNGIVREKILGDIPIDTLKKLIQRQLDTPI